jgi:hypothetical protein
MAKGVAPAVSFSFSSPCRSVSPPTGWRSNGGTAKRTKKKIGAYPSMSLAQAREIYMRDFADVIQKGRSIKIAIDTRPGTVADLFEGYVAALKDADKTSWKETEKGLNKIADTLGRNRCR